MTVRDLIVRTVKDLDLREVAARYGIMLNRNGFAQCPFHAEKTASMRVWRDHFHCYGCAAHGDVLDFISRACHTDFKGAARILSTDFGLNLPIDRPPTFSERARAGRIADRQKAARRAMDAAKQAYEAAYDAWAALDLCCIDNAPTDREAEFPSSWCEAVRRRELALHRLEEAQMKLYEQEERKWGAMKSSTF